MGRDSSKLRQEQEKLYKSENRTLPVDPGPTAPPNYTQRREEGEEGEEGEKERGREREREREEEKKRERERGEKGRGEERRKSSELNISSLSL